jgi:dipeptidyl aminopeptidase/acylaminoacyl peptidase
MADYAEFVPGQRLGKSVSISADGSMVAYASDASGQFNVWIQPVSGGPGRQLTFFTDQAAREVAWAPDGSAIAFTADTCGDEQYQVYLVPAGGGEPVRLSSGTGQHHLAEKATFDAAGRYLLCYGNDRDPAVSDMIVCDLARGAQVRFPGQANANSFAMAISPDGRRVLYGVLISNTRCQCYLADVSRPAESISALTAHLPGEYYLPGPWTRDATGFLVLTTDGDGDHVGLARLSLADGLLTVVDKPAWDVEDVVVSGDGRTVVWSVNEDGYSVLRATRDGAPLAVPPLPGGLIKAMSITADGTVLAMLLDTPARPAEVAIAPLAGAEPVRYVTDTLAPGARASQPVTPELIRYPAADGTPIPAFLYRPAGPGPHPVLLSVHGGPEQQARPAYNPLHQCLLASGVAVLAPNIRGSSGYGHAWQLSIYRDWGGIDLADAARLGRRRRRHVRRPG